MLLNNINLLRSERGLKPLSTSEFFALGPEELWLVVRDLGVPFERLNTLDLSEDHRAKAARIKLVILDVDGVFTDGGMYYTSSGEEIKKFNVKDGMAIVKAIEAGFQFGIISAASRSEVVENRARVLGIQKVYVGKDPKLDVLHSWLEEMNISFDEVAYIGDDVNDVLILEKVGLSAAPADAVQAAQKAAHILLSRRGGDACIREFIENYLTDIK
jgi:YrbI family 3-deoxy-D-manno-octulosonate 8-phosphate phosphatase